MVGNRYLIVSEFMYIFFLILTMRVGSEGVNFTIEHNLKVRELFKKNKLALITQRTFRSEKNSNANSARAQLYFYFIIVHWLTRARIAHTQCTNTCTKRKSQTTNIWINKRSSVSSIAES